VSTTKSSAGSRALLAELDRASGLPARLALVFAGLGGLASVAFAWVIARLVDRIVFAGEGPAALAPTFAALAAVAAIRAFSTFALDRAAFAAAARVRRHAFARLLDRFAVLGPVRLAERPIGELAATATEAVDALAPLWRSWKPAVARAAVVPLAVLVAVFPTDPLAAAIFLLALPLLVWLSILAGRGAEEASGRQWESLARLGGHLLDQIRGLGEMKLAGTSERAIGRVAASAEAYGHETMAVLRIAFLSALVLEFVTTGAIAGVAVAVGFRLLWGSIDFSTGFFVLLLAPEFFAPLREMGVRRHARIEATAALDEIAAVLGDEAPATTAPSEPSPASRRAPPAIRFEGVRVAHADGRVALDRLDLDVAAGETVALVGPSGAGKSTVLALLCGFLAPSAGRILIDGEPLAARDLAEWRRSLVHVPQTPAFFEGSIADNVAMGRPGGEDALRRALAAAGATDLVARLPDGAATPLGEGGRSLSGGEAQRLSLARAFFADGALLLFDEPTAHLDRETQTRVTAAIERLAAGRTAILIAHRRETLAHVDRVVRLEAGRVVTSGPPAAMLGALDTLEGDASDA
jgi:ATP-binding cassette subfamily C protein CydD